jgi:hypothetical protein
MTLVGTNVSALTHAHDGDYACMMFGNYPDQSMEPLWWHETSQRWYGRPFSMMSGNDQNFVQQLKPEWGYHNSPIGAGSSYHLHGATDYAGQRFAAGLTLQQMIVGRGKCAPGGQPFQMRPYFFEYGKNLGVDNKLSLNNDSSAIPVANEQTGVSTVLQSPITLADNTTPFSLGPCSPAITSSWFASTTLTNNLPSSGATTATVASATGFPIGASYTIQIGSEQMLVNSGQGTTSWGVSTRGTNGTVAAAHSIGDVVSLPKDNVVVLHASFRQPMRFTFSGITSNSLTGCLRQSTRYDMTGVTIPAGSKIWIARPSDFPPSGYNPDGLPTASGTAAGPGIGTVGFGPTITWSTTDPQSIWISTGWQNCSFFNVFSSGEVDTSRPYTPQAQLLYCTMYSRISGRAQNDWNIGQAGTSAAFVVRGRWVSV